MHDVTNHPRAAGLTALAAGVLLIGGTAMTWVEGFMAPPDDLAAAAGDHTGRILGGAQFGVIGALALLAFASIIASRLAGTGTSPSLTSTARAGYGGAGILALAGFGALAAPALRADQGEVASPASVSALTDLGNLLVGGMAPVALGLGVGATALAALRNRSLLPTGVAFAGVLVALGLVILPINYAVAPLALLWTVAAGSTLRTAEDPAMVAEPAPA